MLQRVADAIEDATGRRRRPRSTLDMAARDFLGQIRRRRGRKGGEGYAGPDLSRVALPAFWATLLLSQRRKHLAMTLIGEEHKDAAAVRPYLREKQAAQEILDAIPGIDAESLVGFVDVAIGQFQPPRASGRPLVPPAAATAILRAALLRGAIVGELRPDAARAGWLAAHPGKSRDPDRQWAVAQERAEDLYAGWRKRRGPRRRRGFL